MNRQPRRFPPEPKPMTAKFDGGQCRTCWLPLLRGQPAGASTKTSGTISPAGLSWTMASVPRMGILRAGSMTPDERELQARLILTLNQLQAKNERCRGLLIDGNLPGLVTMGRAISDLGVSLMLMAGDQVDNQEQDVLFDPRARAAGEHLDWE